MRELAGEEGVDRLRSVTGLPLSTYFAGPKVTWLLEHVDGAREKAEAGQLAFGTMDSWVLWNLTGGKNGGIHATDVTNASRTLLMDLETLDWHEPALELMGIPRSMLPADPLELGDLRRAEGHRARRRPPSPGILGDQQAALFGQACFAPGDAKNTYGTDSFLLVHTGEEIVHTEKLLTTVAAKLGDGPATYALEGSIAVTGALVQWLRDRLKIIDGRGGGRGARPHRRGQRRRRLRARVLGAVRALLARRRPRRDPRPHRLREPGPHRARGARVGRLAVQGGRRRGRRRRRRAVHRAARGTAAWSPTSCSCSSRPTS